MIKQKHLGALHGFQLSICLIASSFVCLIASGQETGSWRIVMKIANKPSGPPGKPFEAAVLNAIFFADDSTGCVVGDSGKLACTIDGGTTWENKPVKSSINLHGGFFCNNTKGWAVGNDKGQGLVLLTEDAGRNWRPQYQLTGFELSGLHAVWFADELHGWIVGETQHNGLTQGIIQSTEDGGEHWSSQYLASERSSALSAIEFLDTQHGWAVGHNLILRTDDGGRKWHEALFVEGAYFLDLKLMNSGEVWVVGSEGKLLQSTDSGVSWRTHQLPSKYRNLWLASVQFVGSTRGWVAGNNGALFSTNDAGKTWKLESVGMSEFLRGLASTSSSMFAVGNGGVILRRSI